MVQGELNKGGRTGRSGRQGDTKSERQGDGWAAKWGSHLATTPPKGDLRACRNRLHTCAQSAGPSSAVACAYLCTALNGMECGFQYESRPDKRLGHSHGVRSLLTLSLLSRHRLARNLMAPPVRRTRPPPQSLTGISRRRPPPPPVPTRGSFSPSRCSVLAKAWSETSRTRRDPHQSARHASSTPILVELVQETRVPGHSGVCQQHQHRPALYEPGWSGQLHSQSPPVGPYPREQDLYVPLSPYRLPPTLIN